MQLPFNSFPFSTSISIPWQGSSFEFKSIRVGLAKNISLFRDIHFVQSETLATRGNDLPKLNNAIKVYLINLDIAFYYVFSLNFFEYLQYN